VVVKYECGGGYGGFEVMTVEPVSATSSSAAGIRPTWRSWMAQRLRREYAGRTRFLDRYAGPAPGSTDGC
jgi:hypothetical protein